MTELSVYPAAISADESREACAYILWSQAVAVDAPAVAGELEQAPDDLLVPLILLHPAPHRMADADPCRNPAAPEAKPSCKNRGDRVEMAGEWIGEGREENALEIERPGSFAPCCSWQRPELERPGF